MQHAECKGYLFFLWLRAVRWTNRMFQINGTQNCRIHIEYLSRSFHNSVFYRKGLCRSLNSLYTILGHIQQSSQCLTGNMVFSLQIAKISKENIIAKYNFQFAHPSLPQF